MAYPKITWNDGTAHTLQFQLPPTQKPYVSKTAARTDVISTAGVKQSVWLRTDEFFPLLMEYVKVGDDVAGFDAFMTYALQGGEFTYYPDSSLSGNTAYTLEDTDWLPAFKCFLYFGFTLNFRKVVEG